MQFPAILHIVIDTVRDQRSIYVTKGPIFEIPQGSRSGTFSCILYLEEFIFFTFHTKSVLGRSFTYFPIVNTLSEQHLNYRNSEKYDVKKKTLKIGCRYWKKLFIRCWETCLGNFWCFCFFNLDLRLAVSFFFDKI